jgi:hypothetical protein
VPAARSHRQFKEKSAKLSHDERSAQHSHRASESKFSWLLRRELNYDRNIQRQLALDIVVRKHNLSPAGGSDVPNESHSRRYASTQSKQGGLIALFRERNRRLLDWRRLASRPSLRLNIHCRTERYRKKEYCGSSEKDLSERLYWHFFSPRLVYDSCVNELLATWV